MGNPVGNWKDTHNDACGGRVQSASTSMPPALRFRIVARNVSSPHIISTGAAKAIRGNLRSNLSCQAGTDRATNGQYPFQATKRQTYPTELQAAKTVLGEHASTVSSSPSTFESLICRGNRFYYNYYGVQARLQSGSNRGVCRPGAS